MLLVNFRAKLALTVSEYGAALLMLSEPFRRISLSRLLYHPALDLAHRP